MKRRVNGRRRSQRAAWLVENAVTAFRTVRSNRLRSSLTIAVVALGITSLVGILTAVDSMDATLREAYGRMGAGVVNVRSYHSLPSGIKRRLNARTVSKAQAERFVEHYDVPAVVSVFMPVADNVRAEYGRRRTAPVMRVVAADENYMRYNMTGVREGRALSEEDVRGGRLCCVIGTDVAAALFGQSSPIGCRISVAGVTCVVVGVAESTGNAEEGGMDDMILLPYTASVSVTGPDYVIGILPEPDVPSSLAASEAMSLFRAVRRLSPTDEPDFRITRSEAAVGELDSVIGTLTVSAVIIGMITILGAAVGLMNIMLVSVRERRREIGTRKALGATSAGIRLQFLTEAVIICEAGGLIGIVTGIAAGNAVAAVMESSFVIPWLWMLAAVTVCMAVGILSGYVPAGRAAVLDPIECLRSE